MLKVIVAVIAALSVSACLFNKKEEAPAPTEQTAPTEAAPADAQPEQPAPAE